jgi:hypothetical protein
LRRALQTFNSILRLYSTQNFTESDVDFLRVNTQATLKIIQILYIFQDFETALPLCSQTFDALLIEMKLVAILFPSEKINKRISKFDSCLKLMCISVMYSIRIHTELEDVSRVSAHYNMLSFLLGSIEFQSESFSASFSREISDFKKYFLQTVNETDELFYHYELLLNDQINDMQRFGEATQKSNSRTNPKAHVQIEKKYFDKKKKQAELIQEISKPAVGRVSKEEEELINQKRFKEVSFLIDSVYREECTREEKSRSFSMSKMSRKLDRSNESTKMNSKMQSSKKSRPASMTRMDTVEVVSKKSPKVVTIDKYFENFMELKKQVWDKKKQKRELFDEDLRPNPNEVDFSKLPPDLRDAPPNEMFHKTFTTLLDKNYEQIELHTIDNFKELLKDIVSDETIFKKELKYWDRLVRIKRPHDWMKKIEGIRKDLEEVNTCDYLEFELAKRVRF